MLSLRRHLAFLFAVIALLAGGAPARADEDGSRILVARPELQDQLYGASILIAKPMPDGSSLGFILNKPTPLTLGQLFPGHQPSVKGADPIFLGGPVGTEVVFALVERAVSPGKGALQVAPDLYLAIEAETVDRIIEKESDHARFLLGMVVWRPGELQDEMKRGLWYEMKTDPGLVLRKKTEGMWEELVQRSEDSASAI